MDTIETLNCLDIIEVAQIEHLLKTDKQKEVFKWICDIASKALNNKTTQNPVELVYEETSSDEEDLELSDHSSDDD